MTGPAPGWTVDGFDDVREIGRGGSATVYAARQVAFDRPVALKVLHEPLVDPAARRRFERECAALGALHDIGGVVAVHAATSTSDGRPVIVMQLMEESLAARVRRTGPLPADEVRRIGVGAARTLARAHAAGIVHRDLKPANLLVGSNGQIAVGDFDIAAGAGLASSTSTRDALSPPHAPPERWDGGDDGGPSGDTWSLGSTLFELVTGAPPFGDATAPGGMAGLIDRIRRAPLPLVDRADVPVALVEVLARALAKDPAERWPDMASFAAALEGAGAGSVVVSAPVAEGGPEPATRWSGATGTAVAALAVAVAVALTAFIGLR